MKKWFDGHNVWFFLGTLCLFLGVAFGAFGAHGLEKQVSLKALQTFKTGVTYQFYHGFALLFIGGLVEMRKGPISLLNRAGVFFLAGVLLFSFNCYIYALTQNKVFALMVPLGGMSFLLGWGTLLFYFLKKETIK
jgi:uncharacterized membrane protein YgdD (TMEM256/DUF423 family)